MCVLLCCGDLTPAVIGDDVASLANNAFSGVPNLSSFHATISNFRMLGDHVEISRPAVSPIAIKIKSESENM